VSLTVAVTGLNATDNPAPGVPVIRAVREGCPGCTVIGLAYDVLDPGAYMSGVADNVYLMPYPSQGADVLHQRIAAIRGGVYSSVCHLKPGSIRVVQGQVVRAGQRIAELGNSGRSPVPHLHFQLQRQPEVGAPTCYGEILHYVVHTDGSGRYETHGVPACGQRVSSVAIDADVRDALTLAPGRTWTWSVTRGETTCSETWQSSIGPLGERVLEADSGSSRARIYADARYATVLDYDGPCQSLLGFFYLAMGRVPYLAAPEGITWADTPSGTPFVGRVSRVLHELAMPFAQIGAVESESCLERSGPLVRVRTELSTDALLGGRRLPDRIEVTCAPGRGPVLLEAWRGEQSLVRAEVCA